LEPVDTLSSPWPGHHGQYAIDRQSTHAATRGTRGDGYCPDEVGLRDPRKCWACRACCGGAAFPWGAKGRAEIKADIAILKQGALPEGGARGGLPGFVHGLGLLAVTGMVLTGGMLFLYWPEQGDIPEWVDKIGEVHGYIGSLVWAYWGSHIALAVLHGFAGHTEVRDIFKLTGK
jgi:hypothetical protein